MQVSGANEGPARLVHREFIGLLVLVLAGIVGLLLTRAAAGRTRQMHRDDAARWFREAQGYVAASRSAQAVPALRHAVAIDRDNAVYRLALASALAASAEDEGARQVLVSLRQSTPEDPEINVQLARLDSRRQDLTAAIQYYQNALHGVWPPDRADARRNVRIELIEYLLQHNQHSRALSELLVLSANLPDEAAPQRQIARMFLTAGDPGRALDHFVRVLRLTPGDEVALSGAGEAAFVAGDYLRARTYLRGLSSPSARLAEMRVVADLVLTSDPLAPRLKLQERHSRLRAGLEQVAHRLDACPAVAEPLRQAAAAFAQPDLPRRVRAEPDVIDQGVDLIGRVEQSANEHCGPGSPPDRAWQMIAGRHAGESQ